MNNIFSKLHLFPVLLLVSVTASGPASADTVSAGENHTCMLKSNGKAYCWGRNGSGQLGDGSTTMQTEPVAVSSDLEFAELSIGVDHVCGVSADDDVYCWGDGGAGKLGTRSADNKLTPTEVARK